MKFYKFPKVSKLSILFWAIGLVVFAALMFSGSTPTEGVVQATLVNTLMQPLRSSYMPRFDKNELRESRYGAYRFFQEESASRPIFDQETINNIMRSYGNSVVVPVLDAEVVTISNTYARTCSIVDSENTTQLVTLSFASYGWGFSMTPATHYNNDLGYQTDFDRKMKKYLVQFASDLDDLCIAQLEADKNIFAGDLADYYALVGSALQVPQLEKDDFYNQIESIMSSIDFYDTAHIIASTTHMPVIRRNMNQGGSNSVNEQFQFSGGGSGADGVQVRPFNWWPTNRIGDGAGVESTAYIVNEGSVYIGNRNDADTVMGANLGNGLKVWSEENIPLVNLNMGTYYQQDCGDRNTLAGAATAGNTRSHYEGFEFSTDLVVASSYNSNTATRHQPILKAEVLD